MKKRLSERPDTSTCAEVFIAAEKMTDGTDGDDEVKDIKKGAEDKQRLMMNHSERLLWV